MQPQTDGRAPDVSGSPPAPPDTSTPAPPDDVAALDDCLSVIDAEGRLTGRLAVPAELATDDLLQLHRLLVVTRAVDAELVRLQRQGQLSTYPPCLGQEAAQVGTAAALADDDWIIPSYRELGCAVTRGVPLGAIGGAWRGTWFSDFDPRRYRFGPLSVPVGTSGLHAVGVALGAKLDGDGIVVAAYFGDGATSEGDVHEAMNFASVFAVPTVFVVQNNGWAISTPAERQYAAATLARRAVAYGMPGWRCDGNDVLASYATMRRAVDWARSGRGPALVEAVTYRMGPHTTADDPSRYRSSTEVERWAAADPIRRYEVFLRAQGLLGPGADLDTEAAAAAAVDDLRRAVVDAPDPDPLELFDHVYADPPPSYADQRASLAAELAAWQDAAGAGTRADRTDGA